ncbi:gp35 [Burkholderia phage BcepC6B]|uniref:Gp35 n=1 Tax=Burkholderia phage BcepC6B TaxID=2883949 RepID=Q6J1P2_9CAUD|nr:membrane associated protein [Burkholderia phage BcepC6B]AAT38394.1 gp35 [Burkholderia phage BcepC6B]
MNNLEDEATLLIIDGSVSRMTTEEQEQFRAARERIRAVVETYGLNGLLALTYVVIEANTKR